jgi:hypothetical protein
LSQDTDTFITMARRFLLKAEAMMRESFPDDARARTAIETARVFVNAVSEVINASG